MKVIFPASQISLLKGLPRGLGNIGIRVLSHDYNSHLAWLNNLDCSEGMGEGPDYRESSHRDGCDAEWQER